MCANWEHLNDQFKATPSFTLASNLIYVTKNLAPLIEMKCHLAFLWWSSHDSNFLCNFKATVFIWCLLFVDHHLARRNVLRKPLQTPVQMMAWRVRNLLLQSTSSFQKRSMVKVWFSNCHAQWIPAAKGERITLSDSESRPIDQGRRTH